MLGLGGPNINSFENQHPDLEASIYPRVSDQDVLYSLSEASLRSAIYVPTDFQHGRDGKTPVILVPGTGTYGGEAFGSNFVKLLRESAFADPVWLNIPGRMCDESARNAEYVAYAIRYISTRCQGKSVAVVGWSQGCLSTQWTLKYWPSTRELVSNFIAISADFAGTVGAWALCPFKGTQPGTPAVWHQTRNSNFIAALRSHGGDSAYVPTTSIYSATDEVVQPQSGMGASAYMKDERGVGVTNCELQVHARLKPAGLIYSHEAVLYNPLAWALAADAIQNGGPGSFERIDLGAVCMRSKAAGLSLIDATKTQALAAWALKNILLFTPKPWREPELPAYAAAEEKTYVPQELVADDPKVPAVLTTEIPDTLSV
ncbi:esterase/lipase family protein [Aspergillus homomorphus CBS 101889]|uniref:Alpha/beta-hydrolase n=1 Tax=Aspergillus homomorphus (strain CBS 101889) TaxID=1450537 RepID=A0A395HS55_ASPHC|nr:alpha/beta-hydrolase [Aspergillus homomorphus CBS 101889]RAL10175.1 alpha/beta-hydrolase [Aspergillus homomorphus CBS 101889]